MSVCPIHNIGEFIHTEISNSTDLTGYLLFGVLPNTRKEVDDQISGFLARLHTKPSKAANFQRVCWLRTPFQGTVGVHSSE